MTGTRRALTVLPFALALVACTSKPAPQTSGSPTPSPSASSPGPSTGPSTSPSAGTGPSPKPTATRSSSPKPTATPTKSSSPKPSVTPAPTVVAFYNVWPLTHRHIHRDVVYVSQQFNARGSTLTDVELRMTGGQTTLNIVDTVTSKRIATRTFTPYGSGTTKIHFFTPIAVHNGRLYYLELLAQAAAPLAVWFGDTDEQPSLQTHCESHMAGPDVCDDAGNPHPHDLNARIFGRT